MATPSTDDRPLRHLTPPTGWMNDPNGIAFVDDHWHVFYQARPDRPRWGRMHWGHAVSRDLMQWEHLPTALSPGPDGADTDGCWSGCLLTDGVPLPIAFYTGVRRAGGIRRASICTATSHDGLLTWRKDAEGPVIEGAPRGIRPDAFRDPFVWRDGTGWVMLLGAGTTSGLGAVLAYRSADLRRWTYEGPFLDTDTALTADRALGPDEIDAPCWECPQLLRFGDADVLLVSVVSRAPRVRPAHVVGFVGHVRGSRFAAHDTQRVGLGPDFYAPATIAAPDGRRLLFGWVPEDPPRRGSRRTWAGSLTLPRVVSLDAAQRICMTWAAEVDRSLGPGIRLPEATVDEQRPWRQVFDDDRSELRLTIQPGTARSIRLDVVGQHGPAAEVRYEPPERRVTVYRTGTVRVAGRDPHGTTIVPGWEAEVTMRLMLDGSVVELVASDRVTATARLADAGAVREVVCTGVGGSARLTGLEVHPLTALRQGGRDA